MTVAPVDSEPNQKHTRITLSLLVLVILIAAGLRFHLLGAQSLWHDEGNSAVQATRSFAAIAENASRDIHPPGYYWLLKLWRGLLGDTEFGLRSLSAFASLISVALAYALGRSLFGRLAGLAAAALVISNTFSIYYAQEARMYALLAMWSAASMWAFVMLVKVEVSLRSQYNSVDPLRQPSAATSPVNRGGKDSPATSVSPSFLAGGEGVGGWGQTPPRQPARRWIITLGLVNAAGLYTQYAFPFVLIAEGVIFAVWLMLHLWDHRALPLDLLWRVVLANGLALLLFLPWLPTAWDQITNWPNTGQAVDMAEALATIAAYLSYGITRGTGTTIPVLFFLLFGLLMLPSDPPLPLEIRRRRWLAAIIPLIWVVTTVGLFLVFGLYREANLKMLLPAQIGLSLWMARGVHVMWSLKVREHTSWQRFVPKVAAVGGLILLVIDISGGLNALYHDPAYQRDDYRAIAALIEQNTQSGDAVILNAPNQQEVFDYYYDGSAQVYGIPPGLGGDDVETMRLTQAVIYEHPRIYTLLWATEERDPNGVVEHTLDTQAYEFDTTWYGDVRLVRYGGVTFLPPRIDSDTQFGDAIQLKRYSLSKTALSAGDTLLVDLDWQAIDTVLLDYKVFVQLLPDEGLPIVQHDSQPGGGQLPTSQWQPDTLISDHHALFLPADLAAGEYALVLGLYNPNLPSERLPVGDQDFLLLATITIQ